MYSIPSLPGAVMMDLFPPLCDKVMTAQQCEGKTKTNDSNYGMAIKQLTYPNQNNKNVIQLA